MKKNMKKKGFTLIELIVVIAILGILAAVLIPRFSGFQDKARATQALTDAKQIATAADSLIAEDKTDYKGADATTTSDDFQDADIIKIAGGDIKTKIDNVADSKYPQATITLGKVEEGHFTFTYTLKTSESKAFTCVRDKSGAFTTSWND